jgi:hypothetical protein
MEKYGCNRKEEIDGRIKELENSKEKTAGHSQELKDLKDTKKDIETEEA